MRVATASAPTTCGAVTVSDLPDPEAEETRIGQATRPPLSPSAATAGRADLPRSNPRAALEPAAPARDEQDAQAGDDRQLVW